MCIRVAIAPLDDRANRFDATALAKASGLVVESAGRGAIELAPPGECACGFASGDAPTGNRWMVRADLKPPLIAALRAAAKAVKRFRLTVSWVDEPVATERSVTLDELVEIVGSGVIARSSFVVTR